MSKLDKYKYSFLKEADMFYNKRYILEKQYRIDCLVERNHSQTISE